MCEAPDTFYYETWTMYTIHRKVCPTTLSNTIETRNDWKHTHIPTNGSPILSYVSGEGYPAGLNSGGPEYRCFGFGGPDVSAVTVMSIARKERRGMAM